MAEISEMVERVRLALARDCFDGCETVVDGGNITACVGRCGCREAAIVAIKAMREPTTAMLIGARDWSAVFVGSPIGNRAATGCWQSMIDEAIK